LEQFEVIAMKIKERMQNWAIRHRSRRIQWEIFDFSGIDSGEQTKAQAVCQAIFWKCFTLRVNGAGLS